MSTIYLSPPDVGELEETFVLDALRSGWVAPLGPTSMRSSARWPTGSASTHAVALSSGTAALHLALLAWGVGPGDTVVTSTLTFAATANAIAYTGAQPFFVDCDPATGNLDPKLLRPGRSRNCAREGRSVPIVIPVDLLGKCADYAAIDEIAREPRSAACCRTRLSRSARAYGGRPAGSFGDAAVAVVQRQQDHDHVRWRHAADR